MWNPAFPQLRADADPRRPQQPPHKHVTYVNTSSPAAPDPGGTIESPGISRPIASGVALPPFRRAVASGEGHSLSKFVPAGERGRSTGLSEADGTRCLRATPACGCLSLVWPERPTGRAISLRSAAHARCGIPPVIAVPAMRLIYCPRCGRLCRLRRLHWPLPAPTRLGSQVAHSTATTAA